MTTKQQILKDFRERFTSGYGDGTEYRKIVDTNASHIESFLLISLSEMEKSVREETINDLRKTFESDLDKAFEEKDPDKSGDAGYALGVFQRAVYLLSPKKGEE